MRCVPEKTKLTAEVLCRRSESNRHTPASIMRASIAVLAAMVAATSAFQSQRPRTTTALLQKAGLRPTSELFSETAEPPCATPDVIPESVTAKILRSATLTDAKGDSIALGDKMGKGTSIVVFLRHLG